MKRIFSLLILIFAFVFSQAQQDNIPSKEIQIAGAILAAPEEMREGAAVLGYDEKGNFGELRSGTNELVCIADNPKRKRFNTTCYHKNLEPYKARGRKLVTEGIGGQDWVDKLEQEIGDGQLKMPQKASTLHILTGAEFSEESMAVVDPYYRYVIYISNATPESTGLSTKPRDPDDPWLMWSGKHQAHIMIKERLE